MGLFSWSGRFRPKRPVFGLTLYYTIFPTKSQQANCTKIFPGSRDSLYNLPIDFWDVVWYTVNCQGAVEAPPQRSRPVKASVQATGTPSRKNFSKKNLKNPLTNGTRCAIIGTVKRTRVRTAGVMATLTRWTKAKKNKNFPENLLTNPTKCAIIGTVKRTEKQVLTKAP